MNESTDTKASADESYPARSIARTALAKLYNEAEFLQRMCDGQAYNIRQMSEELESLRRMNDRQAEAIALKTGVIAELTSVIARKEKEGANLKAFYNVSIAEFATICREAEFGREMAAVAGVNIA